MTDLLPVVLVLGAVVLLVAPIVSYNRFVSQRASMDSSWASVDVELQRRHDLIPNLVETVKGYAAHERDVLQAVVEARTRARDLERAGAVASEQARAENVLSTSLGRLLVVAEEYPELQADTNFRALQAQLTETEDRIAAARRLFNIEVQGYNRRVEAVPSNIVASVASFVRRDYFEVLDPASTTPVDVQW